MSLQWTAVATFLYAEVFAVLLLCIPFISPKRWQKIFKSRLVELVVTYGNTFFVVLIVILVLLVIDAVREIRKYDDVTEKVNLQNNPGAVEHFHMKLFRAQRNLYIAGFSLLLSLEVLPQWGCAIPSRLPAAGFGLPACPPCPSQVTFLACKTDSTTPCFQCLQSTCGIKA
ncbi:hypothetical protein J1605_001973 [Eschrichtius robustus]|uniref:B-cell receptor-associated protein n=1 Tax=Eschrichtius robustus TaxID=9764 RepID=A0AB34GRM8_ESCRO|nr:hypothetical protein J1605_010439 [Eschrichtius robustus]KAJ8796902.1 hypothetical protein J1605_001973 [Eschrichtius robustus]